MVRKGELACRNGWDNDLWEPVQAGQAPAEPAAPKPAPAGDVVRPLPVSQPAARAAGRMQEDVVVGQAPVMPDLNERTALLAYDTRLAIDEARERHRRRAASTNPDEAVPSVQSDAESEVAATNQVAEAEPTPSAANHEPVADPFVRIGDLGTDGAANRADDDPFDEVPAVREDIDLPRPSRPESPPVIPMNGAAEVETDGEEMVEPWFANGDPRRARLLSEVLAQRAQLAKRRGHGRFGRSRPYEVPPPVPANERETTSNGDDTAAVEGEQQYVLLRDPRERYPRREEPVDQTERELEVDDRELVAEAEPVPAPPRRERSAEVLPALDDEDELLTIPTVDIAPDVPRMCRTCRDFRPSDSGDRGWCTNKWAFSHRRMVNADELPCLTSVGCWWLPHDVIWLSTADVGRHSEPTPLVDRWLAERSASEEAARPAMRRRQS